MHNHLNKDMPWVELSPAGRPGILTQPGAGKSGKMPFMANLSGKSLARSLKPGDKNKAAEEVSIQGHFKRSPASSWHARWALVVLPIFFFLEHFRIFLGNVCLYSDASPMPSGAIRRNILSLISNYEKVATHSTSLGLWARLRNQKMVKG